MRRCETFNLSKGVIGDVVGLSVFRPVKGLTIINGDGKVAGRKPVAIDFACVIVGHSNNKDWNNRYIRTFFYNVSNAWFRRQERIRIRIWISASFWMEAHSGIALFELVYNSRDGIFVEFFLGTVSENGGEHCAAAHEEVDDPTEKIIVEEIGSYGKEDSSRQGGSVKIDPRDDKEVEKSSMVGSDEYCILWGQVLDVFHPLDRQAPGQSKPNQGVHKRSIPIHKRKLYPTVAPVG